MPGCSQRSENANRRNTPWKNPVCRRGRPPLTSDNVTGKTRPLQSNGLELRTCQWKHPLMKPKLALKLVPISGFLFDLHTAHYAHFGVAKLHTLNDTNQSGGEKNTEPVSFTEARFQLKKRFVFCAMEDAVPWFHCTWCSLQVP